MNIGILAGEASGDLVGAGLITALRELQSDITITGIGGPRMIHAGCHSLFDMNKLSVMGFVEPLLHLPELFKIRRELIRYFLENKPDVFIGIDSPGFNLGLEHKLHQAGIPVIHYVSPSVWAWHQKRIFKIKKCLDLMLTLFPFETKIYEQHGVPVKCVGHPLADGIALDAPKNAARKKLNLDENAQYIALLPGSRRNEIKYLAKIFIQTADICWKKKPNIKFITSAINAERDQEFRKIGAEVSPHLPIQFFENCSHDVMQAADVVLVTSGTATLETLLFKRPMVIAYKMANLTYQLARHLVKIPFIGLPNLLANQLLVPEFIQAAAEPEKLSEALLDFLDHPEKIENLQKIFLKIHQDLRKDANRTAAEAVIELVQNKKK